MKNGTEARVRYWCYLATFKESIQLNCIYQGHFDTEEHCRENDVIFIYDVTNTLQTLKDLQETLQFVVF
jgi:hypothetical protein